MASFGETLRRERELRGVSLREIADATKISVRFLQALEQDRLEILPGGVFRRSFVKQYAKHLGLDADRLVAEFVYAHGEQAPEPAAASRPRERTHPGTLFLIAAVGSAAVLSLWKAAPRRADRPAAAAPAARVVAAPAAALVPADADPVKPVEGLVLTLLANQTCWIEVHIDGQPALNRVLEQGQTEKLLAQGEIVLSVGNAGGLRFTVNDLPGLPLGKSGEVRRNIVITKKSLPSFVEEPSQLRASHSSY
jgi:cytoskeletal protein RodZ